MYLLILVYTIKSSLFLLPMTIPGSVESKLTEYNNGFSILLVSCFKELWVSNSKDLVNISLAFTKLSKFSGILTKCQQLYERKQASKEDLCFSIQETCFAMLAEVVERAMAHTGKKELLLVGGVGANKRFCEMLNIMCKERNAKFYKVPMDLAGDQGAMIAWEGFLRKNEIKKMEVDAHWRADEV